jgi:capsular polysaccharide transport system permease protein
MNGIAQYLRNRPLWLATAVLVLVFTVYWNMLAARRYVSEAHVVVDLVQSPSSSAIASPELLSLASSAQTAPRDLLLLRDYLLSADMLAKLDAKLGLRAHYSGTYDPFSRMLYKGEPLEWFLYHYHNRVSAEYDEKNGVLVIQAQAYTPKMAQDIVQAMLEEGGSFINELAQNLARTQVVFAENEVAESSKRLAQSRQRLIDYQNIHGLASPGGTLADISAVVARLESERSDLQARRNALESYLAPSAPDLVQVDQQIRAVDQQLRSQRARLASTRGNALNRIAEEYDRLTLEAGFYQAVYQTAITALERARIDATRTLKKVSVLQRPTLPQYSAEPGRLYYSTAFALGTLLLAGILQLLIAVIREHRD